MGCCNASTAGPSDCAVVSDIGFVFLARRRFDQACVRCEVQLRYSTRRNNRVSVLRAGVCFIHIFLPRGGVNVVGYGKVWDFACGGE